MTQKGTVDIRALAELARLDVSGEELSRLENELPGILTFVEQIQQAAGAAPQKSPDLRNVMREDKNPHESGIHTETLLAAAPSREGNHVAVKQVISKKK